MWATKSGSLEGRSGRSLRPPAVVWPSAPTATHPSPLPAAVPGDRRSPAWRQCRSPHPWPDYVLSLLLSRLHADGQLHQTTNPHLLRMTELLEHDVIKRPQGALGVGLAEVSPLGYCGHQLCLRQRHNVLQVRKLSNELGIEPPRGDRDPRTRKGNERLHPAAGPAAFPFGPRGGQKGKQQTRGRTGDTLGHIGGICALRSPPADSVVRGSW